MASTNSPAPVSPLRLRRPRSPEDYLKLELNSLQWDGPWNFTFSREWFARPTAEESRPNPKFWDSTLDRDGRIDPRSRNWCNWLLLDREDRIWGRHFTAGLTQAFRDRQCRTDLAEPIFPMAWADLRVPDPARPETGRYGMTQLMVNLSDPFLATPLVKAAAWCAALFRSQTLFTQVICHEGDPAAAVLSQKYGLHFLRSHPVTQTASPMDLTPDSHFEIWAWERNPDVPEPYPQALPDLPEPLAAIPILARFYQTLTAYERQTLNHLIRGRDRTAASERMFISRKRVDQWIAGIRDNLMAIKEELESVGIVFESGTGARANTLFAPVSRYLERLAWFYGEEEMTFPYNDTPEVE